MATLKLKKPIKIDGIEKTEIEYDLDGLTGEDVRNATTELQKLGIMISTIELDVNYHAALFARASGLSFMDINRLSIKDHAEATKVVRDFFLADVEE